MYEPASREGEKVSGQMSSDYWRFWFASALSSNKALWNSVRRQFSVVIFVSASSVKQ